MTFSIFECSQIFLILLGRFQIFGVRKNAGFSLVDLNFFAPIFSALDNSQNFDAMDVRRDWKSPPQNYFQFLEIFQMVLSVFYRKFNQD